MEIKLEKIKEFQILYKEHFGVEIDENESYQEITKLIQLVKSLYKPMTKKQYETYQNTYTKY